MFHPVVVTVPMGTLGRGSRMYCLQHQLQVLVHVMCKRLFSPNNITT
jgi:hypothetical protein